jgi:N-acetylglucosamine-6-sulfatase
MKYLCLTLLCFTSLTTLGQHCGIHPPTNLKSKDVGECSITLTWNKIPEASDYQVRYRLSSNSQWSQKVSTNMDTFYVFTGLLKNRKYDLSVRSVCSDGTKSSFQKTSVKTSKCSLPSSVSATVLNSTEVQLSWDGICLNDSAYYKYKTQHGSFISSLVVNAKAVVLTGLNPDSVYLYQISTCTDTMGNWTEVQSFSLMARPNIVLIIIDDARSDFYSCNGAAPFFQTPYIDRIANEGVNFKNYFDVCSICAPSRACMATGLYPVKNGATDNDGHIKPGIKTVNHLLHEDGYYTAMIGKNHGIFKYQSGDFDYWMSSKNDDSDPVKFFDYNGSVTAAIGSTTKVFTDSAFALIERTNDPLFLWLSYRVPHDPVVPSPEYVGLFDDDIMPIGPDTAKYTVNYPSYLDGFKPKRLIGGQDLINQYKNIYEVIAELDSSVGRLFDALEESGKLDNTLLIFVSDNGHMLGEHGLFLKRLAYDPSMRIPLFMRYPKWFSDSSVNTNQMTLNIDIAPTILDAAGIPNTYDMDGSSLNKLYSGETNRETMYYQYLYATDAGFGDVPGIRAIRDFTYKYVYHGCINDTTEEFFDLVNDPDEMTNLVNVVAYDSLIQTYRDRMTAARQALGDTLPETKVDCYIKNPLVSRLSSTIIASPGVIQVFPNPSTGNFTVTFPSNDYFTIEIFDAVGQKVYTESGKGVSTNIHLSFLAPGLYFIRYRNTEEEALVKWVMER